jgi:hypothetical protein
MANRHQPAAEIINHAATHDNLRPREMQELRERLERNFRRAFDVLEQNRLIEPASGMNGTNGFVVLTPEGEQAAEAPIEFDLVRVRARLVPEMLHRNCGRSPSPTSRTAIRRRQPGSLQDRRHRGCRRSKHVRLLRREPDVAGRRPRHHSPTPLRTSRRAERSQGSLQVLSAVSASP